MGLAEVPVSDPQLMQPTMESRCLIDNERKYTYLEGYGPWQHLPDPRRTTSSGPKVAAQLLLRVEVLVSTVIKILLEKQLLRVDVLVRTVLKIPLEI